MALWLSWPVTLVSVTQHMCGAVGGSSMERGVGGNPTRLRILIPDTGTHTSGMTLPRRAWVRLIRLLTGVGRFRSCLYKCGMPSSAACERGAEEQTVDHVVLQCPIHRPPLGLHGLTVLDDEATERLLNTCPEIQRGQAVDIRTRSKERSYACTV